MLERLDPKEAMQRVFRRVDGYDMGSRSFLLGGQREFLTVLMSDIVSFTAYVADTELQEVTQTLNDYFTLMTDIVVRHHGHVDKYVGDGLMAIFREAPGVGHHANRAVYAALEMLERLRDLTKGVQYTINRPSIPVSVCIRALRLLEISVAMARWTILPLALRSFSPHVWNSMPQRIQSVLAMRPTSSWADISCGPRADFVPKGFAEAQCVWQVHGPQPLLKFSVEFVAPDAMVTPHPGVVAIALGPRCGPGLIGRQPRSAVCPNSSAQTRTADMANGDSATALVYAQPHLVLHHVDQTIWRR